MKTCCAVLLSLAVAAFGLELVEVPVPPPAPPVAGPVASATLHWLDGATLTGEWVGASARDLTWKTPLFDEPLVLGWEALRRIDRVIPAEKITDPFSVVLRDGGHLYGDLVSVDEETVSIRSARHGKVALKRSEVLSIRRLRGGDLIAAGPTGDAGWDIVAKGKKESAASKQSTTKGVLPIKAGPAGTLQLPYWKRTAYFGLALPESVDVEFRVRSSQPIDFSISLEAGAKQRLSVETWDDELVLVSSDQFKVIRKLAADEREVALRICWDRKARKCALYTPAGEWITDWVVPEVPGEIGSGLVLENKGRDLTLEFVRVRVWDGKPPAKIDANQPRLELADGRIMGGSLARVSAESVTLRASEFEGEASFPLDEVDALIMATDAPKVAEQPAALWYADGTVLFGRIESMKENRIAFTGVFSAEPLNVSVDGLRQCLLRLAPPAGPAPELPLADLDRLVIQKETLRGRLINTGDRSPRWLPVGGMKAVTPAKAFASEITRGFPLDAEPAGSPVLFYINSGDVLPGKLRAIDRSHVEITSSVVEADKLSVDDLNAMQFGATSRTNVNGFNDPGWIILKGDDKGAVREGETLKMTPGAIVGHPSIMLSTEIQFLFINTSSPTVRLRLFCAGTDAARSMNLIIANWGSRVYFGVESTPGQLDNQHQMRITPDTALAVRLVVSEKEIELFLNGVSTGKFAIENAKRAGVGLVVEPASLWGNTVRDVTLAGFSTRSLPGSVSLPEITAETRLQTLTVPRFRRNDLPRHALLATNGDVLRGEIEAATATHFGFRVGLENLRVSRDRVKAAIWLRKPEEASAAGAPPSLPPTLLQKKINQKTRYSSASLSSLTGFLQREAPELKFKLPEPADNRRFTMQFNGQTIAEALDQICSMFGISYRVEGGDTVIIEPGVSASPDLMEKVYWLKGEAFPKGAAAQKILTGKAIQFPKGASAKWEPGARLLSMTNTAESHKRLGELLDAEFGGNLGSPTHWLLLTNGARLGLMAESFGPEAVLGQHPVYGRCTVPVSMIQTIRTSPPPATATIKSVADWRLAYAPEPVLPETGGESSPLLGTAAKSFKLPLLAGGEFDLDKAKGKVVVLDFWATWCGPCIKAVPELIEAMTAFPSANVEFIGVNQSEPPDQVKRFLEARGWKLSVAMDAGQIVARQFGVDGIPHTVIVAPDGKVAWVKSGYSPDGAVEAASAVKQLLAAPAAVQ